MKYRLVSCLICLTFFWMAGCSGIAPVAPKLRATQAPQLTNQAVEAALQQAARLTCPSSDDPSVLQFSSADPIYSFVCTPTPGHSTKVVIQRFATVEEAQAAFNAARGANTVSDFHGYPLSGFMEDDSASPGGKQEHRIQVWRVAQWLVNVRAFDATEPLGAPDPTMVSEALYQAAIAQGLLP